MSLPSEHFPDEIAELNRLALGDLPEAEAVVLRQRIESDPVLAKEYRQLQELYGTLACLGEGDGEGAGGGEGGGAGGRLERPTPMSVLRASRSAARAMSVWAEGRSRAALRPAEPRTIRWTLPEVMVVAALILAAATVVIPVTLSFLIDRPGFGNSRAGAVAGLDGRGDQTAVEEVSGNVPTDMTPEQAMAYATRQAQWAEVFEALTPPSTPELASLETASARYELLDALEAQADELSQVSDELRDIAWSW